MTVAYSDSLPTLYVVHGRAKLVIRGPNSTEPNLIHHGETTYRIGWLSEYATGMLFKKDAWTCIVWRCRRDGEGDAESDHRQLFLMNQVSPSASAPSALFIAYTDCHSVLHAWKAVEEDSDLKWSYKWISSVVGGKNRCLPDQLHYIG